MVMVITTESMIFAGLISSYFYLRATSSDGWPLGGLPIPPLMPIGAFSIILVGSSIPVHFAQRAIKAGHLTRTRLLLAIGFLMGAAFLAYTVYDFANADFPLDVNAYSSIFHATIGLHALHVLVGLMLSFGVQLKAATGRISSRRHLTVEIFVMYWHFVDAVWIVVFSCFFLSVR
jgi:heme/copper-type cytochrome/quinol oxidase subunit 3